MPRTVLHYIKAKKQQNNKLSQVPIDQKTKTKKLIKRVSQDIIKQQYTFKNLTISNTLQAAQPAYLLCMDQSPNRSGLLS